MLTWIARPDIKSGDNWHPSPQLISQMLSNSSSADGSLSVRDFASYRVQRENTLTTPFGSVRDLLATGEVALIVPAIGRGSENALEVSTCIKSSCCLCLKWTVCGWHFGECSVRSVPCGQHRSFRMRGFQMIGRNLRFLLVSKMWLLSGRRCRRKWSLSEARRKISRAVRCELK